MNSGWLSSWKDKKSLTDPFWREEAHCLRDKAQCNQPDLRPKPNNWSGESLMLFLIVHLLYKALWLQGFLPHRHRSGSEFFAFAGVSSPLPLEQRGDKWVFLHLLGQRKHFQKTPLSCERRVIQLATQWDKPVGNVGHRISHLQQ